MSGFVCFRFFQRSSEASGDDRYWPIPKFQELLMQIRYHVVPDSEMITEGTNLSQRLLYFRKSTEKNFSESQQYALFPTATPQNGAIKHIDGVNELLFYLSFPQIKLPVVSDDFWK